MWPDDRDPLPARFLVRSALGGRWWRDTAMGVSDELRHAHVYTPAEALANPYFQSAFVGGGCSIDVESLAEYDRLMAPEPEPTPEPEKSGGGLDEAKRRAMAASLKALEPKHVERVMELYEDAVDIAPELVEPGTKEAFLRVISFCSDALDLVGRRWDA